MNPFSNPMFQEAVKSLLRHVLTIGAGYLVARGIWTQDEATSYVGAAALALIGLGLALWDKYISRSKLVTALATPTLISEKQAATLASESRETRPPVSMPKDRIPYPVGEKRTMGGQEKPLRPDL
jgi:hypothetical protein